MTSRTTNGPRLRTAAGGRVASAAALAVAFALAGGMSTAVADGTGGADGVPGQSAGQGHGGPDGHDRSAGQRAQRPALVASGRFAPPSATVRSDAVTYDMSAVPAGASIAVSQRADRLGMSLRVAVRGVEPDRTFGVHVHTEPCGSTPDASGPHYQNFQDPRQPSTDPVFANPYNEVWLDLATDGRGEGVEQARQYWRFRPGGARSVVLHEHATATGHGEAGTAGDRLACFTVPFAPRGQG